MHSTVFLLSPAYCGGRRATQLMHPGPASVLGRRLEAGSLPLGEAFAFMSGLYFRGKIAYSRAFGRRADGGVSALVITPTRGLQSPDLPIDRAIVEEFAALDVSADEPRYREPLLADARSLRDAMPADARVVLLGSIATSKYVDVLGDVFGLRLHFPHAFVGRGDMSRGALMLRSAESGIELEYVAVSEAVVRRGPRPPKLQPAD
jgi:hypothetical protein